MDTERDPVERAQIIREKAAAGLQRADELVRRVDELTERIQAHRRSAGPAEQPQSASSSS